MEPSKVWFVTGSSVGLGRAAVLHLLEQGDKVIATLRKPEALSDISTEYSADQLLVVKLDVTSIDDIQAAFSKGIKHFGRIDVVYNNAGFSSLAEVEGTPDAVARSLFEVNFWGSANISREAIRVFRDVNKPMGGRIIQASSMAGAQAMPAIGYYSASKYAIEGLTEALSKEVHPSWNIKMTLLELGGFSTRAIDAESLVVVPEHPAYTAPECATKFVRGFLGPDIKKTAGDASKAAREVRKIAYDDTVGLRVPLGLDAISAIAAQAAAIQKDVENAGKWSNDLKQD